MRVAGWSCTRTYDAAVSGTAVPAFPLLYANCVRTWYVLCLLVITSVVGLGHPAPDQWSTRTTIQRQKKMWAGHRAGAGGLI